MGIKSDIYFAGPSQRDLAHTIEPSRADYVDDLYIGVPSNWTLSSVNIEIDINDFYWESDTGRHKELKAFPKLDMAYAKNVTLNLGSYVDGVATKYEVVENGYCPLISYLDSSKLVAKHASIIFQEFSGTKDATITITKTKTSIILTHSDYPDVPITYDTSDFPSEQIPHRIFVAIQAGGGGGGAGESALLNSKKKYKGGGGGGAFWAGALNLDVCTDYSGSITISLKPGGGAQTSANTNGNNAGDCLLTMTANGGSNSINIGGGYGGTSSGGSGGVINDAGKNKGFVNGVEAWWPLCYCSGGAGGAPNTASSGQTYDYTTLSLCNAASSVYHEYTQIHSTTRSQGTSYASYGGGGGGYSVFGNGGNGAKDGIKAGSGGGHGQGGGGGSGYSGETDGAIGGGWWVGIYY